MKRLLSSLLIVFFFVLSTVTSSVAGSRYHAHSYRNYYGGHHGSHYYGYPRYSHHSSDFLAYMGVGLLAGAVVGSIFYQPPPPRTIVYSSPPPVIIQSQPAVVRQYSTHFPPATLGILRQVKSTVQMLNLRSGPGLEEEVIGQAILGETLGVIGAAPEWLYVTTENGQQGWVMTAYTREIGGPVG